MVVKPAMPLTWLALPDLPDLGGLFYNTTFQAFVNCNRVTFDGNSQNKDRESDLAICNL